MSQQIQCPHCGQSYALTDEQVPQYVGQTITCTRCQKPFTVASNLGSATPPAASPPPQVRPTTATSPYPPARPAMPVGYAQGGYAPQQTSGLAVASLVIALIGMVVPLLGIVGIVLGVVALTKMKDPRIGGKGLAIGGIAVGAVSILMTGCLIAILLPSLNRARETARSVHCASNLRQIGQALLLYANDNSGAYPPKVEMLLTTQDITAHVFNCPAGSDTPAPGATPQQQAAALNTPGHLSYVYVGAKLTNAASADTVVAYEPLTNHNGDGANFLWGDGHVSWESKKEAKRIIDQVSAGTNPPSAPSGGH